MNSVGAKTKQWISIDPSTASHPWVPPSFNDSRIDLNRVLEVDGEGDTSVVSDGLENSVVGKGSFFAVSSPRGEVAALVRVVKEVGEVEPVMAGVSCSISCPSSW